MAAVAWGGSAAAPEAATNLTTLLSLGSKMFAQRITVKNSVNAVNNLFIGNSDVTTSANIHIELAPGASYDFEASGGWLANSDEIYVVGTAGATNIVVVNGMA